MVIALSEMFGRSRLGTKEILLKHKKPLYVFSFLYLFELSVKINRKVYTKCNKLFACDIVLHMKKHYLE